MKLFLKLFMLINVLAFFDLVLADDVLSNIGDESQSNSGAQDNSDNDDVTGKVERIVWPFTRWVEEKVQSSPLIRTPKGPSPSDNTSMVLDLRSAIKQATSRYPGTVLNVDKRAENSVVVYLIRIISEKGVVKTIKVDASNFNGESN